MSKGRVDLRSDVRFPAFAAVILGSSTPHGGIRALSNQLGNPAERHRSARIRPVRRQIFRSMASRAVHRSPADAGKWIPAAVRPGGRTITTGSHRQADVRGPTKVRHRDSRLQTVRVVVTDRARGRVQSMDPFRLGRMLGEHKCRNVHQLLAIGPSCEMEIRPWLGHTVCATASSGFQGCCRRRYSDRTPARPCITIIDDYGPTSGGGRIARRA